MIGLGMQFGTGLSVAMQNASPTPADSIGSVLSMATEAVTWTITSMGSFISFIASNPLVLIMFILTLVGFGVGMLMRIWKSV